MNDVRENGEGTREETGASAETESKAETESREETEARAETGSKAENESGAETKEELLRKLADAAAALGQAEEIRQRLERIKGQYRMPVSKKKMGKSTGALLLFCAVLCLAPFAEGNALGAALLMLETAGICCVLMLLYRMRDQGVERENRKTALWNEQVEAQERELSAELERVKTDCRECLKSWYPQKYAFAEAARFFYDAVKSGRADSLEDAVQVYETEGMWKGVTL